MEINKIKKVWREVVKSNMLQSQIKRTKINI